ncbi:MAG: hypothetical protein D6715_07810 [Calditrichaeota bacterium]|nr:MAG: hypothetical protein D6715_07810 [Calditrichota bacterium]
MNVLVFAFGLLSGFKHAFEPDHVLAVSTLLHREKKWSRALRMGLAWGAGHTTTLTLAVLVVNTLRIELASQWLPYFELPVALMLLLLGGLALRDTLRRLRHLHVHTHDGIPHAHVGSHPHPHTFPFLRQGWRGYLVGLVHGMAGSGALLLLVAATLPSRLQALGYALCFGAGSILGMGAITTLLALPFQRFEQRPLIYNLLTGASGLLSIFLALYIFQTL